MKKETKVVGEKIKTQQGAKKKTKVMTDFAARKNIYGRCAIAPARLVETKAIEASHAVFQNHTVSKNGEANQDSKSEVLYCLNDGGLFHGVAISAPMSYDSKTKIFGVMDRFCSPGCLKRWILRTRLPLPLQRLQSLMTNMMMSAYNIHEEILAAPEIEMLSIHGGPYTLEQYRAQYTAGWSVDFVYPPFGWSAVTVCVQKVASREQIAFKLAQQKIHKTLHDKREENSAPTRPFLPPNSTAAQCSENKAEIFSADVFNVDLAIRQSQGSKKSASVEQRASVEPNASLGHSQTAEENGDASDTLCFAYPPTESDISVFAKPGHWYCLNDGGAFYGVPIPAAMSHDSKTKMFGVMHKFCSPGCLKRWLLRTRLPLPLQRLQGLMTNMMISAYNVYEEIKAAPKIEELSIHGGCLSLAEYRAKGTLRFSVDFVVPPFTWSPITVCLQKVVSREEIADKLAKMGVRAKLTRKRNSQKSMAVNKHQPRAGLLKLFHPAKLSE